MRRLLLLPALIAIAAACGPAATASVPPAASLAPSPPPESTPSATPGPTATPLPTPPAGTTGWPLAFDIAMSGTYWSSPPFSIPFAITIGEEGWFSGHLHAEFIDLQRFDGMTQHQFPNVLLGFANPQTVRGNGGAVDVATLTPEAALDLWADRASLTTSHRAAQALFGIEAERIDLHSSTSNNPLFGGEAGNFGLGPELDARLVVLPLDGRLFIVAVLAPPGDVDAAWDRARPILDTVRLAGP